MEPLVTTKRVLVWLWMCPADENSSKWKKIACYIFALAIFVLNLLHIIVYIIFVTESMSIDFERSLFAAMLSIYVCGIQFITIFAFAFQQKIDHILKKLSNIYRYSEYKSMFRFKKT